jgi:glycolate oxidase FAD binding subunit
LAISGGGSKGFYGRAAVGEPLSLAGYRGIIAYEPQELFITARSGSPLTELQAILAEQRQYLPFEPPIFSPTATIGGAVAAGLTGSGRPYLGALRDFVLGVTLLDGTGQTLHFGGQVVKNVAGFDCSRLMAGAMGTLGVLLEISVRILPRPAARTTIVRTETQAETLASLGTLARTHNPVTAASHDGERLVLRLAGARQAVAECAARLGGERLDDALADAYWAALDAHRLPFFAGDTPLWRISLPPSTKELTLPGAVYLDWGGAIRWLRTEAPAAEVRALIAPYGGHATLFRGGDHRDDVFPAMPPVLRKVHERLKAVFDPAGILNPGRLYAGL